MFDLVLTAVLQAAINNANGPAQPSQRLQERPIWAKEEPVTLECLTSAILKHGVNAYAMAGIMRAEDGRVGGLVRSPDGSYDFGPMGINSTHLAEVAKLVSRTVPEVAYLLIYDGCFNVNVAAWHLRRRTDEAGGDIWAGVGRYHSRTREKAAVYIPRVDSHLQRLIRTARSSQQGERSHG